MATNDHGVALPITLSEFFSPVIEMLKRQNSHFILSR